MSQFKYKAQHLYAEGVSLKNIASTFGTPAYVYSQKTIEENWHNFANTFKKQGKPHKIFYAVKANSNISILRLLATMGAGFDTVSGGEIQRALAAGASPQDLVFSGVGKSAAELRMAINLGIHSINVESQAELLRVQSIAQELNKIANIAIRINPDISANSHPYISTGGKENKFGIDHTSALDIYTLAASLKNLNVSGISCHIGSQIITLDPFISVIQELLKIIQALSKNNIHLKYINVGGGLGVCYKDEIPPTANQYVDAILTGLKDCPLEVHIEPGRSIVADAGILLTKVEYLKMTDADNFAITDAGMNDLIRPALYDSYHGIQQVYLNHEIPQNKYSVVGPVCESSDFFAKDRALNIEAGDLLAVMTCGAYGFSMSSNYNTRPRCAEILVNGDQSYLIRKRETIEQLLENEIIEDAR